MTFRRRQLLGWGILAIMVLMGGSWLLHLDFSRKISSDVLDLIPLDEESPELMLVRSLASEAESRTMLFELTTAHRQPAARASAMRFAAELRREPAFDQALVLGDPATYDALGKALFDQRFALLFPLWLRDRERACAAAGGSRPEFTDWLVRDVVHHLEQFLATPEALAFQDLLPADPLLLMPGAVNRLTDGVGLAQPSMDTDATATLVWARLSASPLVEAGQSPAFSAIDRAATVVRATDPGFTVAYTGVNRFAAASRARIKREVSWLNTLSLVAVLTVAFTFIRRIHRGLHLIPVVLLSVLGAWVCSTLVFERIHIMVFLVGSMLTGVAIDYGFYLFMQPAASPGEDYWAKVRRLAKPLLASCLTTVAGFALLLFSDLPFIRQLGVFVGTGLICALGAAIIYFSTVRVPFLEARSLRGLSGLSAKLRIRVRRLLIALWIVALPGLALLTWKDDIRELQIPSPALEREDARINALFGDRAERTVYLSYGKNISEARASLETFESWLHASGDEHTRAVGLGAIVPTAEAYHHAMRFEHEHPDFEQKFREALIAAGFDPDGFAPFFDSFRRAFATAPETGFEAAVQALQGKLTGPAGLLLHTGQPLCWFVTLARSAPSIAPPAATHTVSASQLQSLNRIFSRYRQSALWLSLIGLAVVGAGVFLSYGWRDGARIFAIPCGACLGLFGLLGWIGHPLNLFHLLGAFLGVCLTHNYSIFSATSAYRREAPPVSVRMSALTTFASFGVLALSGIPVVRALGSTVALMVLAALIAIECEHLTSLGNKRE